MIGRGHWTELRAGKFFHMIEDWHFDGRHLLCAPEAALNRARAARTKGETVMSETIIGLFPDGQQAEEVVPMLANRGYGQRDVEKLGGKGATLSGTGSDLVDKLADLGVAEVAKLEEMVEAVSHGGVIIAARTPDERKAGQIEELMLDHGATQCVHAPDTGWTAA